MAYQDPFGGSVQNPSQVYLASFALTGDLVLYWPWSGQPTSDIAAKIMRISTDTAGRNIDMPVASQASTGEASIIINTGANTFNVNDSTSANITNIAAGTAKFVYLIDNSTDAGTWGVFTFGTGSSGADASALAGAGLIAIANTLNEEMAVTDFSGSGFNLDSGARAGLYNWTSGAGSVTTSDPSTLGTAWFAMLRNSGNGTLTLTPAAGTVDGNASKNFNPGDAAFVIRDGGNLITLGFGQSTAFTFDYVAINVAGTGSFTLSSPQQNRISYKFTGVLTGDRTIIVPATVQQYWVTNATTGAFQLDVRTSTQTPPGPVIATGEANILYCDGTNVVPAVSGSGISTPVSIANGGTGATTASGARTNLGSTTVGDALFVAASAAAARSTLGLGTMATQNASSVAITGGSAAFTGATSVTTSATNAFSVTTSVAGAIAAFASTDSGATAGPAIDLLRASNSPAPADLIGAINIKGSTSSSSSGIFPYASIGGQIIDPTAATASGALVLSTVQAASILTARFLIGLGLYSSGVTGGDKGAGTLNATGIYINGTAVTSGSTTTRFYGTYASHTALSITIPLDDSIPQIAEGTQVITINVVTTSATQRVRLSFNSICGTATDTVIAALFQGAAANAINVGSCSFDSAGGQTKMLSIPATEVVVGSATTTAFSVRVGGGVGNVWLNGTSSARLFGGSALATLVAEVYEP